MKDIRTTPPADLFEEILELQDTLDEFRASDRTSESASTLRAKLNFDRTTLSSGSKIWKLNSNSFSAAGMRCKIAARPQNKRERNETAFSKICGMSSPTAPM